MFETIGGYSNRQDFESMLQLAYVKFTQVNFDKKVSDSGVNKQKIALSNNSASPSSYFNEQIFKALSQNNPRDFNPYDITNPNKAKFEDVTAIYKDRIADASGFTFVFVGNLQPEKMKPLIVKYLGS